MTRTTLLLMALIALVGCGDDGGRGGGSGDGDPGDDGSDGSGDPGDTGGDPSGSAAGDPDASGSSGDPSGSTSGGGAGITCGEIWECYEDCSDIDCTIACYDQGSDDAKALDDDLWTCIFENDCNDGGCIDQMCGPEKQACVEQG